MAKRKIKSRDVDGRNAERVAWAETAIGAIIQCTRTDREDALTDLLGNLMHWAEANDMDFDNELRKARYHWEAETGRAPY